MKNKLVWMSSVLAILMTSCGGSSSTAGSKTTTTNVTGVYADAPVVGMSYACGSETGTTGTGGTFTCPTGSTVNFSVGAITVCSAPVHAYMTPVSCAQANGDSSADASTPSVVAVAQFLISIGTPTGTTPGSLSTLTITSAELKAASGVNLDFATATQAQLQTGVTTINPGQTLASPSTARNELTGTVTTNVAGTYSGTYSGDDTGTWTMTIDSSGDVSGSWVSTGGGGGSGILSGALANGTTFSGSYSDGSTSVAGSWSGIVNTAQSPTTGKGPYLFSGTWDSQTGGGNGAFTN